MILVTTPRSAQVAAELLGVFVCLPIFAVQMTYWFGVAVVSVIRDVLRRRP